nr:MAG TPA: hypothetical protein [Caudoviricetes sp.]
MLETVSLFCWGGVLLYGKNSPAAEVPKIFTVQFFKLIV